MSPSNGALLGCVIYWGYQAFLTDHVVVFAEPRQVFGMFLLMWAVSTYMEIR